jgi:hypothetical protein
MFAGGGTQQRSKTNGTKHSSALLQLSVTMMFTPNGPVFAQTGKLMGTLW